MPGDNLSLHEWAGAFLVLLPVVLGAAVSYRRGLGASVQWAGGRAMSEVSFVPLAVAVVTISDTRDLTTDTSGGLLVELLGAQGHQIAQRHIIKDDLTGIRALFAALIADASVQVIIATGGTGITARDVTVEALEPLVTKPIVGFGELFRWLSFAEIGASTIQSRATAALCDKTLVFVLPGSRGAVRLAMERIILPQLDRRTRPCNFAELMPRF